MSGQDKLVGLASLRDLLLATPSDSARRDPAHEHHQRAAAMDQEEVARKMAKYDLNVMPVVDEKGMILGVITIDDIVDVLTQEQTEDVQKLGGVEPLDVPYFQTSFFTFIKKRAGWLFVLFFGEFFTQTALRHYDPVFEAVTGALLLRAAPHLGGRQLRLAVVDARHPRHGGRRDQAEATGGASSCASSRWASCSASILAVIGFVRVLMYPEQHVALRAHRRRSRSSASS